MIKNVVFDIGRVLIEYEPVNYLKSMGYDDEKIQKINEIVFYSKFWIEAFDRGTYTYQQGIEILSEQYPDLKDDIKKVLHKDWLEILTPMYGTVEFLKELKNSGYKIYFLSNFSKEGFEYISSKYDFFSLCDGKVVSAYISSIKPEKEIYKYLLDTYNLVPDESVFIDDLKINLDVAEEFGIKTILFKDIEDCRNQFKKL